MTRLRARRCSCSASVGAAADWQLRLAHRDRRRLARAHARGRADAPLCDRGAAARPERTHARNRLLAVAHHRTREREGYVPNVVYTCGAIVHANQLIVPYGFSDAGITIAQLSLSELLEALLSS